MATRIGIAGPSGSGKSHLARALREALPGSILLSADDYYLDLAYLSMAERQRTDFDQPNAIDHTLLASHLAELGAGQWIEAPVYDFSTHTRTGTRVVEPGEPILVEGLFLLCWPDVMAQLDRTVYVDASVEVCLARRIERDVTQRGRTEAFVKSQFEETVLPSRERYVEPGRVKADLVVDGTAPVAQAVDAVRDRL
jgi:uridine kinase